jgi:hypothetical protein
VIPAFVGEYLPPGAHPASESEVEASLVVAFLGSSTRERIFDGWIRHRQAIAAFLHPDIQWVDGSFVSTKLDPGDIDVMTLLNGPHVDSLDQASSAALSGLFLGPGNKPTYWTDSYAIAVYPPGHVARQMYEQIAAHWDKWWGTARDGTLKGYLAVG